MTRALVAVAATNVWTSPDAIRPVDSAAVAAVPDLALWAAGLDVAAGLDLRGRVQTQLLLGEPVQVIEERGDWSRIVASWQPSSKDARGYPGWVATRHLELDPSRWDDDVPVAIVHRVSAGLSIGGPPEDRWTLSWATRLPVLDVTRAQVVVQTPNGPGRLGPDQVTVETSARPAETVPELDAGGMLVSAARQFIGLAYLWSGATGWGLDCSGLIHTTFRRFGIVVPRDAVDQHHAAKPVRLDDVRVGDLYFFAGRGDDVTHVGFATSAVVGEVRTMLHAPRSGRGIEEAAMSAERRSALVGAGRLAMTPTASGPRPTWS